MRERVLMRFLLALLIVPALALLPAAPENRTLVVNGQPADVTIIQINGRAYADLEALARVVNGAVGFKGNQVTLTLLGSAASNQAQTPGSIPAANSEFSKEFVRAGIEEMSNIREWRSALANRCSKRLPGNRSLDGWLQEPSHHEPPASFGSSNDRF